LHTLQTFAHRKDVTCATTVNLALPRPRGPGARVSRHSTGIHFSITAHLGNSLISSILFAGLVVAAIVGLVGWSNRSIIRRRRFGWSVLYDEVINQGDPVAPSAPGEDGSASAQNMWEIVYQEGGPHAPSYPVRNGSLAGGSFLEFGNHPRRRRYISFLATEHLYTNSAPSGLAAAFIDFLTSGPMATRSSGPRRR
jgi:hypothetical protein